MNCVTVRDRLTEHALGVLEGDAVWQVERHLEWCAGCRKEAEELLGGVETVSASLPPVKPPPSLEDRVVRQVLTAAGRRPASARRQTVRALAAAALAAAIFALGAMSWGFAERRQARDYAAEAQKALSSKAGLAALVANFQAQFQTAGKVFQAELHPGLGRGQTAGPAVVFAAPNDRGFALVQVVTPLPAASAPYAVELVDTKGDTLRIGTLERRPDGDYLLANLDLTADQSRTGAVDLARLTGLNVVDRAGRPVLTGTFHVTP
ncbi:MAG TPA: zf-HC2 domain-containing protein [Actinomycetota bacterium]|nr:zf-HC2 domain-containing protein [Actinomycetota bacterium]